MKPMGRMLLALAIGAGLAFPAAGVDEEAATVPAPPADPDSERSAGTVAKFGTVRLAPSQQQAGGLILEPLRALAFQPEGAAYGKVLDIQPLLMLRTRYRAARAEAGVAAAALDLAEKNRARLRALHRAEIVAGREWIQAEAQWRSDRARTEAAQRLPEEIRQEAEHAFGSPLAHLALDGEASLFDDLAAHRRFLIRVTLPAGKSWPSSPGPVFVAAGDGRSRATRAEPISPAPGTDEWLQGETWFFQAAGGHLRSGMRVDAWVPLGGQKLDGVAIPLSAVVWHAGKPWVYRQIGEGEFARTEVAGYREYGDGWFVDRGFEAGTKIVTTGGQMLLSEEFRRRIPDEDDE